MMLFQIGWFNVSIDKFRIVEFLLEIVPSLASRSILPGGEEIADTIELIFETFKRGMRLRREAVGKAGFGVSMALLP